MIRMISPLPARLLSAFYAIVLHRVAPYPTAQGSFGPLELPALVFGAGTLSSQYNTEDHLTSDNPVRAIRLALRYASLISILLLSHCCLMHVK
jgi:hypothetical protein